MTHRELEQREVRAVAVNETIDKLAADLRQAAYPNGRSWNIAADQDRWRVVARLVQSRIERGIDKALREAIAKAHELGQHAAARAIREMRAERDRRDA